MRNRVRGCGCAIVLTFTFASNAWAVNIGDFLETTVGQLIASDLQNQFGLSQNPQEQARIQNVALRLVPFSERKGIEYQFNALGSSEVNAYAAPGGFVFVNDGLMEAVGPADDELAFVLAHEMSHVEKKHGISQLLIGTGISMVLGGGDSDKAGITAQKLISQLLISGRSRDDEREADEKAIELIVKAGYDPAGGLAFMRRLETLSEKDSGLIARLFATHPPTVERSEVLKDSLVIARTGFTYKESSQSIQNNIADAFDWPVGPPNADLIRSVFTGGGWRIDLGFMSTERFGKIHVGEDYNWGAGADDQGFGIYAIANGEVIEIKNPRNINDPKDGWRGVILIKHRLPNGQEVVSLYGHLMNIPVNKGDQVSIGQKIGEIGPTPKGSTGPHLHFEIRTDPKIGIVNPYRRDNADGWVCPSQFIQTHRAMRMNVVNATPPNGSYNVSTDSDIVIELNQQIDPQTIANGAKIIGDSDVIDIIEGSGFPVPTPEANWSVDGKTIHCNNWYCEGYTRYEIRLTLGLKSVSGLQLDKIFNYRFSTLPRQNQILIEAGPEHLGDDQANSKTIWLKEFELSTEDISSRTRAKISLKVKGTPRKDPMIYINRQKIGYAVTNTGKWEDFEFGFSPAILREGNNLIDLETVIANLQQTFDDCEFAKVYLWLE